MLKRFFDVVFAFLLLIVTTPISLLAIGIILFGNWGPVLFRQERVGLHCKPFQILKFRTMRVNLDDSFVTSRNDSRVFPGGGVLRRLKIDELPQLINVLLGEMSLVGPRPTVAEDYKRMTERQRYRAEVRPGITGLTQISGNTALLWNERIELDLEYIAHQSIWYDFLIICKTALLIVEGRAETHPDGEDEWG